MESSRAQRPQAQPFPDVASNNGYGINLFRNPANTNTNSVGDPVRINGHRTNQFGHANRSIAKNLTT